MSVPEPIADVLTIVECDGCEAVSRTCMQRKPGRGNAALHALPSLPITWAACGMSDKRPGQSAYWCPDCVQTGKFNQVLAVRREALR